MGLDQLLADRESKPLALGFGCEKRLEYLFRRPSVDSMMTFSQMLFGEGVSLTPPNVIVLRKERL